LSQIALIVGRSVKLDKGQLDLLMAGSFLAPAGAKDRADMVGKLAGHVEQPPFARGLMVCHGRLD
jgi:hypothetical protein